MRRPFRPELLSRENISEVLQKRVREFREIYGVISSWGFIPIYRG